MSAVGRLVRLQRRQRAGGIPAGHQRLRRHALRGRRRRRGLDARRAISQRGKASALGAISGAVAGLATVTQGAGFVQPFSAVLIGLVAGAVCYLMVAVVKEQAALRRFAGRLRRARHRRIHRLPPDGRLRHQAVNNPSELANGQAAPLGWIDGNPGQVLNQLIGAGIGILVAVVGTLIALRITELITPLRIAENEESTGMDLAMHGEEAYNFEA